MNLKEIKHNSEKMLANFLNEIGRDGEFYISACNYPIEWGQTDIDLETLEPTLGHFINGGSKKLERILEDPKFSEEEKRVIKERGLILISEEYKTEKLDKDLFLTVIHETIHSMRNLLLFDVTRNNKNQSAYTFNDSKFEQNTVEYNFSNVDASQEILKGNIDTTREVIDNYDSKTSDEIEDIDWKENKVGTQMEKQIEVDEALVELMSVLSYELYSRQAKGEFTDIWHSIEQVKNKYKGVSIGTMCKIILKHQDFELFYWMLDPIAYSNGDMHYDFFGEYAKDDQDLLQEFYELAGLETDESLKANKISKLDIQKVATSQISIEELLNSLQQIKQAQFRGKENRR